MITLKEELNKMTAASFAELLADNGGKNIIVSNPYGGEVGIATRNDRVGRNNFVKWWNDYKETDTLYYQDHGDGYYTIGSTPDDSDWLEVNVG